MIKQFRKEADDDRFNIGGLNIPKNYDPLEDQNGFMNPVMIAFFWQKLHCEYVALGHSITGLQQEIRRPNTASESIDHIQTNNERNVSIREAARQETRRRHLKGLIDEIEKNGTNSKYGYSRANPDEAIELKRLMSEPATIRTIDEQEDFESDNKIMRLRR